MRGIDLQGLSRLVPVVLVGAVVVAGAVASRVGPGEPGAVVVAMVPVVVAAAVLAAAIRAEHARLSSAVTRALDRAGAVVNGVAEAVVVTSPEGEILEWNAAAQEIFGCPPGGPSGCSAALGLRRGIETLDCRQGCALLRARLEGRHDGTTDGDDQRLWRTRADGARQPLLAHAAPILDGEGCLVEVVHSFRDVSSLVEAEEAKTLFLATASHELKTPLTVILGYSELMLRQEELADEARRQGLRAIHERARQLADIVNRILLSSRIEAGTAELTPVRADPLPVIEDAVSTVTTTQGRHLDFRVEGEVGDALVDPEALRTVLDHLVENALKYSRADTTVHVRVSADDRWVTVDVRDHGIGMTRAQAGRCFDRFWQAESGDVRHYGGTGIGLYIVKSLVDAMRGEVAVSTAPGEGSTFVVRIPTAPGRGAGQGRADAAPAAKRVAAG